jgi:hypothetical protein
VIDPVSSSSITHQKKKRPLEDDTATTGAYLQLVLHTRFSILDLFFILFALYALNTDQKKTTTTLSYFSSIYLYDRN